MCGIQQHQLHQLAAGLSGEDRPAVTGGCQSGQQSGVVEMGVRNHHGIQAVRVEGKWRAVAFCLFPAALAQAALQQHLGAVTAFDQVTGTGDLLNGAKEVEQGHGTILL
ncbi:hypothetical protein D9M68_796740 [compost metagenome]